jgi:tRNA(Ile)-lysidine synthase
VHGIKEQALKTIRQHGMLNEGDRVLIALSGGPDSTCLASVLSRLADDFKLTLHAHYIDHGLRPDETPSEIAHCEKLCNRLGMTFSSESVDVKAHAKAHGLNLQDAGRELRYKALENAGITFGALRIALGHTLDDQVETFFMRVLRGSGPAGLASIPPIRGRFIRPLLGVRRSEVEAYLSAEAIEAVVDSSNLKDDYLRNRLRSSLMPLLEEFNPSLHDTLRRTTEILADEERYFFIEVTKALMKMITSKTQRHIELFITPLESMDRALARRVIRRAVEETRGLWGIGYGHIDDILGLARHGHPGDSLDLPHEVRAIRKYSTLILTSEPPKTLSTRSLDGEGDLYLEETGAYLSAAVLPRAEGSSLPLSSSRSRCLLDAGKTRFPLTVRSRRDGDFFMPLGFGKRKKIQDYFTDEKIPRYERNTVPIVTCGDDIVWIAGYRPDERFKPTESTKSLLVLEYKARN